jgi:hypothetical protein
MRISKKITIFILFFILFAIFTKKTMLSWGDSSRMATIQSLVDNSTFIIDRSLFNWTGDKYFYNNHFYSDKPPVLSIYGALVYFLLKNIFNISFANHYRLACYLITLLTIGFLSCLGLVYFYKILVEIFAIDEEWADITTLVLGTGTLVLPYSIALNNHSVSGVLLLLSFYYLLKYENNKLYNIALSGLLVSIAGSVELNCFLFIPFAFVFLLLTKSFKSGIIFLLACVPFILIFLGLNIYTSGSLIPPAMNKALWNYPGSIFNQANLSGLATHKGISGILIYTFHMIIGNRGLISHTPVLLVSIYSLIVIFKSRYFVYKKEFLYISAASFAFILLYILKTVNYSGYAFGIRWFATVIPLLCLSIAHIGSEIRNSRKLKILFIIITCISILFSLLGTFNPFPADSLTDSQRYFNPPNTLLLSIKLIATESSMGYKLSLFISACIIYFIFFKLLKKLNSAQKPVFP